MYTTDLQVVVETAAVALQVKAVEEQGDDAVLWCLQDDGAVQIVRVDLRPARALQVPILLLKGPATV